jgi:hypothetical protein
VSYRLTVRSNRPHRGGRNTDRLQYVIDNRGVQVYQVARGNAATLNLVWPSRAERS